MAKKLTTAEKMLTTLNQKKKEVTNYARQKRQFFKKSTKNSS